MAYATKTELLAKVGAVELAQVTKPDDRLDPDVLDRVLTGGDTSADPAEQVALAEDAEADIVAELDRASRRMDLRLRVRYTLPFPTPAPPELLSLCLDIARYFLHDILATEEIRNRYKDAMAELDRLASGDSLLTLPDDSSTSPSSSPNVRQGSRVFTSASLEGFVGCRR